MAEDTSISISLSREAVMKNFYNRFFVLIRINFELLINWWEGWKFKWRDMPLSNKIEVKRIKGTSSAY